MNKASNENILPFQSEYYCANYSLKDCVDLHNEIELIYVEKGTLHLFINCKIYNLKEGEMAFINSYEAHKIFSPDKNSRFYVLKFAPELTYLYDNNYINKEYFLWLSSKRDNAFCFHDISKTELPDLFAKTHKLYTEKKYTFELKVHSNILHLCVYLYKKWYSLDAFLKSAEINTDDVYSINKAFDIIFDEFNNLLTKGSTARSLSKISSTKIFRNITGFTPLKYFERLKMNYALLVIDSQKESITKIAFSVGFSNSSYFSKCFSTRFEMTPTEFIKQSKYNSYTLKETKLVEHFIPDEQRKKMDELLNNRKKFFHNYVLIGIYMEHNTKVHNGDYNFYEIIFIDSGSVTITIDNEIKSLNAGEIMTIPPHTKFTISQTSGEMIYMQLQFYPEIFSFGKIKNPLSEEINLILSKKQILTLADEKNQDIIKNLIEIVAQNKKYNSQTEMILRANTLELIALFLETLHKSHFQNEKNKITNKINIVEEIINYIDNNFTENISLSALAKKFDISYSYLSAKFKMLTKTTFNSYLNKLRIDRAVFLVMTTNFSFDKISSMVGYCRRSHFTDEFCKIFGITPREFRKRIKNKTPISDNYDFEGIDFNIKPDSR